MAKTWKRQEGETSKAYEAFCIYRDMGPSRSLGKVHDQIYGEDAGNIRYVEKWSSKHGWVARAQSFDDWRDEQRLLKQMEARERATERLTEAAVNLVDRLIDIGLGQGEAQKDQVKAIKDALDRAGVTVPKEVNLDVSGELKTGFDIDEVVEELGTKSTAELAQAYFAAIEGTGEASGE